MLQSQIILQHFYSLLIHRLGWYMIQTVDTYVTDYFILFLQII